MSKFSLDTLRSCVFPFLGIDNDPDVILGSSFGEDVAVTRIGEDLLLSHVDPIVGAVEGIGRLALHVACNDIACSGIKPRWAQILVLVPDRNDTDLVKRIMQDASEAAKEAGVSIIGGHTGYSSGITRPVVAVTAMAPAGGRRVIRTGGISEGNHIIITGGAGIEGTSILAVDFAKKARELGLTGEEIREGVELGEKISIIREASLLADLGATAMHDVTRGGIMETLLEMALLSSLELDIHEDHIPVCPVVSRFARAFGFDPMGMISSGSLAAAMPPETVEDTLKKLHKMGIPAGDAGIARKGNGITVHRSKGTTHLTEPRCEDDELARMWVLFG
jgi:hydrogenase expression/formation protein HypE